MDKKNRLMKPEFKDGYIDELQELRYMNYEQIRTLVRHLFNRIDKLEKEIENAKSKKADKQGCYHKA